MEIQLWREILDPYRLAVDELVVKFNHIIEEYRNAGLYSPIEQVAGRVKTVSSILDKAQRKDIGFEEIEEKIKNIGSSSSNQAASDGDSDRDEYFERAGRYIIEKDKASIGMLQRVFKIGFNRAARIMDQLCEAGVVGEEEGTKPRKVLMSMEQFEQYMEEYY